MCFVWIWEQTAIISLYNINWLVYITETECVYWAVRTGPLDLSLSRVVRQLRGKWQHLPVFCGVALHNEKRRYEQVFRCNFCARSSNSHNTFTDRQRNWLTDRPTNRPTDRLTDWLTDSHGLIQWILNLFAPRRCHEVHQFCTPSPLLPSPPPRLIISPRGPTSHRSWWHLNFQGYIQEKYFKSEKASQCIYSVQVMRSALFWHITQLREVIPHRRFATTYRSHLQGPVGCVETSVRN